MSEADSDANRRIFSGHYLDVAQAEIAEQYRAVDARALKLLPIQDVIGFETVVFGLFADSSGGIRRSLIKTERSLSSRPEVISRSIGELAFQLSSHLTAEPIEEYVFKDWQLGRQLMYESAASEAGLKFLGGLGIYQHEPRTPLKAAVIYPGVFTDWVFHERERLAIDIQSFQLTYADASQLERELLTARPQTIARFCGKSVLCGLTDILVTDEATTNVPTGNFNW